MKALLAFILAFLVAGTFAEPEKISLQLKKSSNTWNVPIVAKQANENKPTQVVGGYPKLELDTLARPLKSGKIIQSICGVVRSTPTHCADVRTVWGESAQGNFTESV